MNAIPLPTPLERWRSFFGVGATCPRAPRRVAGLGYVVHGPAPDGLVEVEKVVLAVLYDERLRNHTALRLAGFSGCRVPWGVQWGGPAECCFFKDLRLQPIPGARGLRLDTNSVDLLRLGLELEEHIRQTCQDGLRSSQGHPQLPNLWAGFRPSEVKTISGQGPELTQYCRKTGQSAGSLMARLRREYFGLALYPLAWVSHHWRRFAAVFADLDGFPAYQVFPLRRFPDDLVGFQGAAEYDFFHSRFRRYRVGGPSRRLPAPAT